MFISWLYHLFTPHCKHCEELKECKVCRILDFQLRIANEEKERLLGLLVSKDTPAPVDKKEDEVSRVIPPRVVPWHVKQRILEEQERKAVELAQQFKEENEKLEKEVGI